MDSGVRSAASAHAPAHSAAAAQPSPPASLCQVLAPSAAPRPSEWKIVGSTVLLKRYGVSPPNSSCVKLAAFDMDGTIIKTKSGSSTRLSHVYIAKSHFALWLRHVSFHRPPFPGNTFPTSERDWVFLNEHVPSTLRRLHEQGYTLVIFSNQAGFPKQNLFSGRGKQVMSKVDTFTQQLSLPITAYLATARDGNRKPQAGMLHLFLASIGCESLQSDSFFCGDAAGRDHDHSADDKGFAEAAGLKFMLPEQVFVVE